MQDQKKLTAQQKQKVLFVIRENDGEIISNDSSQIKAVFPENKVEMAVRTFFIIVDRLNHKAELFGGIRLVVFLA
jgi:hypothetical protein